MQRWGKREQHIQRPCGRKQLGVSEELKGDPRGWGTEQEVAGPRTGWSSWTHRASEAMESIVGFILMGSERLWGILNKRVTQSVFILEKSRGLEESHTEWVGGYRRVQTGKGL